MVIAMASFQYISCYCLSSSYLLSSTSITISIHLMLLFIAWFRFHCKKKQNISIHLMLLFISDIPSSSAMYVKFQYISCYCLSLKGFANLMRYLKISIHLMLLFIAFDSICKTYIMNFNTSHVTVYHWDLSVPDRNKAYFNTSHVTVYQGDIHNYENYIQISIHLMLLFI